MARPASPRLTRSQRRMLRRHADRIAALMADTCTDYTADGQLVPVTDPVAILSLQSAFAAMLRAGGRPMALKITRKVAMAFPGRHRIPDERFGAQSWLAVGLDPTGRGTYSLRHLEVIAPDPSQTDAYAARGMLSELGQQTAFAGFPPAAGS